MQSIASCSQPSVGGRRRRQRLSFYSPEMPSWPNTLFQFDLSSHCATIRFLWKTVPSGWKFLFLFNMSRLDYQNTQPQEHHLKPTKEDRCFENRGGQFSASTPRR